MVRTRGLSRPVLTAAIGLALAVSGCHSSTGGTSDTTAITNRPQSYDRFIAILKLRTPALLSTARREGKRIVVDEGLKRRILDEQEDVEERLQALSPDLKVLYRYRLVLNALAIVAPKAIEDKFAKLDGVSYVESDGQFDRLVPAAEHAAPAASALDLTRHNTGTFIGADRIHAELGITGKGVVVGVIDTGIDYTHAMLGGAGTPEAYQAVKPSEANPGFPTDKVIGGIDLVGTDYDSGSPLFEQHIPKADANPLDEAGHGSHVSGTIAGHGDGVNTYDGIAPDAKLYAIKIFGKKGSTGDAVILEALETAANPRGDLDPSDHLDVINLSLGGDFGTPHTLYREAVRNLSRGGDVAMVCAAGNAGASPYIVSLPSIADEALSVAASIDDMDQNWKFGAVKFVTADHPELLAEAVEASFAKPIAQAGAVRGKLVYVGLGDKPLTDAQKAALSGNVALIDRGVVAFSDKAKRANEGGAIGLVVANNQPGDAFGMGGDGTYAFPAIMITKTLGDALKADMLHGDAMIEFQTDHKIQKPQLIDTLTDFSSRGPRSVDGAIKPEIAAPGSNVISAKMGSGALGVQFSGTSMATPHMAGVLALLRQAHPELSVAGLKALVMGTALALKDQSGVQYPVSAMGAGRVRAFEAASAKLLALPAALSLGEVLVDTPRTVRAALTLVNLGDAPLTLALTADVKAGLTVTLPKAVTLPPHAARTVAVHVKITPADTTDASAQLDGFINITGAAVAYHVPLLAVVDRTTRVAPRDLVVAGPVPGAKATLTLANRGETQGEALAFNLIGLQPRNGAVLRNPLREGICQLQSAGWRLVKKPVNGADTELLQVAVKLYNPVTSWQLCDVSVLFDAKGDGTVAQELIGTSLWSLSTNQAQIGQFVSALTDAAQMRKLRHDFEVGDPAAPQPDFTPAILDAQAYTPYAHSTVAVVQADLSKLAKLPSGDLKLQLVVSAATNSPSADTYLGDAKTWLTITPTAAGEGYAGLPDDVTLAPGQEQTLTFATGGGAQDLVVYLPYNESTSSPTHNDAQQAVLQPTFAP